MKKRNFVAIFAIAIIASISAIVLYSVDGAQKNTREKSSTIPEAAATATAVQPAPIMQKVDSVEVMIERLRARLEREPNDIDGWVLLARSYHYLARWDDAKFAFEKARELGYRGDANYASASNDGEAQTSGIIDNSADAVLGNSAHTDEVFSEIGRIANKARLPQDERAP